MSRRGIVYTVTADVCTFDDPKDNVATTPPANVCTPQAPVPASAGTLAPDTQPDDFRRATVTLSWNTGGRGVKTLSLVSLINNPSGGLGPRITVFTAPPDNASQLTTGTAATFPTTTSSAGTVRWNTDGSPNGAGDSTGGPTTWTTTWDLGSAAAGIVPPASGAWPAQYSAATVLDGTYTATAQAFNDLGIAGDSRVAVLPLNRSLPITVAGFEAGRNSYQGTVDFTWNPNPERDIIGYRVYNTGPDNVLGNGNDSLVCSTSDVKVTSCSDPSPPSGTPSYGVVALDRTDLVNTSSAVRESQNGKVVSVPSAAIAAPLAPSLLVVTNEATTGKPSLSWVHLFPGTVRFFRIYRDSCCSVANRYDATAANALTWTDPRPGTTNAHLLGDRGRPEPERVRPVQPLRLAGAMRASSERGFTLIELLLVMSMSILLLGATLTSFTNFERKQKQSQTLTDSAQIARNSMDHAARQLRNLANQDPSQLTTTIALALPYDLVFQTSDPSRKWVRYCLDTAAGAGQPTTASRGMLWESETLTAAAPTAPMLGACPGTGWSSRKVVADRVTNRIGGARSPRVQLLVPDHGAGRLPVGRGARRGLSAHHQHRRPALRRSATRPARRPSCAWCRASTCATRTRSRSPTSPRRRSARGA